MPKHHIIGNPLNAGFNPDVHIIIKQESSTGQTRIESGNGIPINPLYLVSVLTGIIKANVDALLQAQLKAQCNVPHTFVALAGETKCRVPYCTMPPEHEIHNVTPQVQA